MGKALTRVVLSLAILLVYCASSFALDPSLDVSQYGHTAWTARDGFSVGTIFAMAQTPDGYLWLGSEFGLFRFDGVHALPWQPPAGQQLPDRNITALLAARDGRLWIGTFDGLLSWNGTMSTRYPELNGQVVRSLIEDREGTVWVGGMAGPTVGVTSRLCAIRSGSALCYGEDGAFGRTIWALYEDSSGNLWAGADSGLWRWRPGSPRRYPTPIEGTPQGYSPFSAIDITNADDGRLIVAMRGTGLLRLAGEKVEPYPRVGTQDGLSRWKNGQVTVFRKASGLPDDVPQSLFQDDRGRIWVFTRHGLAYFQDGRFVAVKGVSGGDVHWITGDKAGNLWLSDGQGLLHLLEGRLVEQIPWPELGRRQSAGIVLWDRERGGLWLGFWDDGGVLFFKDGQLRASYTAANGLGEGKIGGLQLDRVGTLWVATQAGGLSRIKDGRIATLTTRNGLPCDIIHWSTEDDDGSFWLYTVCGLVRIARTELDAWIADSTRRIKTTVWDAADGVILRSTPGSPYGPRVTKSGDGKLWFVAGEGIQVVDPRHLAFNSVRPSVHIERVVADHKIYWQNLPGISIPDVRCLRALAICRSSTQPSASRRRRRCDSASSWKASIRTGVS